MHVAEMDFDVAKEIRNHIVQMTQNSDLGYLGPIPELAPAFSSYAKSRWNWDLGQNPVRMATDVGRRMAFTRAQNSDVAYLCRARTQ